MLAGEARRRFFRLIAAYMLDKVGQGMYAAMRVLFMHNNVFLQKTFLTDNAPRLNRKQHAFINTIQLTYYYNYY